MTLLNFVVPIGALTAAGVALAQPAAAPRHEPGADVTRQQVIERVDQRFQRLDANNDGRFTLEEARAQRAQRRTEMRGRMFERLDTDRDGSISRAEFDQAHAQRAEPGGMRRIAMMRRLHRGRGGHAMMGRRLFGEQGFVTREQMRERALARFDRLDSDDNGTVTAAERREARHARRAGTAPRDTE